MNDAGSDATSPVRQAAVVRGRRWRRRLAVGLWRVLNPVNKLAAGWAPWWVLVETTGRRTGRRRTTPLAAGPGDSGHMWLLAVHGRHSGWVCNLTAQPAVRIRHRGRWRQATASLRPIDPEVVRTFNRYARTGPKVFGIDPCLVRIDFED